MIRCIGYVNSAQLTEAKTGTPGMMIRFDTDHDEYGSVDMYLWFSDAAWPYSRPKLEYLGFNGDFESPEFSADGFNLSIELEQFEGKTRPRVDLADFGGARPAGDDVKARMRQRWRAEVGDQPARPAGRPSAPASPPAAPPASQAPPPAAGPPSGPMTKEQINAAIDQVASKDQAWRLYAESTNGSPDVAAWRKGVEDVMVKNALASESEFGPPHWRELLGKVITPF